MRSIVINERSDGTFLIEEFTPESVFPTIEKKDSLSCGRRILQLLNLKEPVAPQDWPEKVGITEVEHD